MPRIWFIWFCLPFSELNGCFSISEKQSFGDEKWERLHLSINKVVYKLCCKLKSVKPTLASNVSWKQITLVILQGCVNGRLFWHISLCWKSYFYKSHILEMSWKAHTTVKPSKSEWNVFPTRVSVLALKQYFSNFSVKACLVTEKTKEVSTQGLWTKRDACLFEIVVWVLLFSQYISFHIKTIYHLNVPKN